MNKIQKDLGERLHQSKEELDAIKTQMKGDGSQVSITQVF